MMKQKPSPRRRRPAPPSQARAEVPQGGTASPFFRFRFLCGGGLLACILLLAYLPALRGGFIWDDHLLITDNPLVTGAHGPASIWTSTTSMDYTPLTTTATWLEWRAWGGDP